MKPDIYARLLQSKQALAASEAFGRAEQGPDLASND